jgi:hypothetical protein
VSITVTPALTVAGATVAGSMAGEPSLVAVDKLSIAWGRASVLEQPQAATAALTLLDRSPGATFARRTDLIGQLIMLRWEGSDGSSATNFRGRITDVSVTPLPGAVPGRGFRVALAASSIEVDLANYKQPDGTVWPAETFGDRRARIVAALPAGLISTGLTLPGRFDLGLQYVTQPSTELATLPAAAEDVSGKDLLALIRELYASTSPLPAVFDPSVNGFSFPPRRMFTYGPQGLTVSAMLVASPDHGGRYVPASLSRVHLDGHLTGYAGALTQQMDSRVTRVEVTYPDAAAGDTRTAVAATINAGDEATIGRRVLAVTAIHSAAANAQQLANLYADMASVEARTPRLGSISYSSDREPIHDAAHANALLAGAETAAGVVFLGRSWLPQLGARPLVAILGGTVTYSAGAWEVDLTPGPTALNPGPGAVVGAADGRRGRVPQRAAARRRPLGHLWRPRVYRRRRRVHRLDRLSVQGESHVTIHTTTNYGIAYVDTDTALVDLAAATQQAAATIDAALGRGGIAPPDATTQAQLAARVTAVEGRAAKLELDPVVLQDAPNAQSVTASASATVHPNRVIDPLLLFGAGVGALVTITAHVMVDNAGGNVQGGADFTLNAGVGAATPAAVLMDSFTGTAARYTMRVNYTDIIPAGSKTTYSTTLSAKLQTNNTIGGNAQYNRARYQVRPYV